MELSENGKLLLDYYREEARKEHYMSAEELFTFNQLHPFSRLDIFLIGEQLENEQQAQA